MSPENKSNILVVDDLPDKLLVMESILEELGQNIIVARSGEEALLAVLQHDFAVILLDVNMPSMDGYETAALIRKRRKSAHTPIIFITSFADELHKTHGYSLGAVDYILSPVNPEILRTKVQVFVHLYQMAEQAKRLADERVALVKEQAAREAAEAAREAAEAAHRRSSFLADATTTLARSIDFDARTRDLSRLPVPFLCDLCAVTLVSEFDAPSAAELAWSTAGEDEVATANSDEVVLPAPLQHAIKRVLESGQKEQLEGVELPWSAPASSAVSLHAAQILPLRAGNTILGALALCLWKPGRRFDAPEVQLAEDLAARAAVLLENGRLYRNIQESDARKNEFLAMLAHELRNPLAAIRGAVQVLEFSDMGPDKVNWARAIVERQVKQLVRLVDDLLDVARITQGKIRLQMEPVNLNTVVDLAVELSTPFIDARRHHLSVSHPSEPLWVRGDSTRLAQVLANLLNNAAKYTDEGGQIWLSAEREQERAIVRVRDNGIGIPRHLLASIFELFTQVNRSLDRSQGGLGIGLTLVRHLVEMHHGSVGVTSSGPSQGSEFVVRLPLLPALEIPAPAPSATTPAPARAPAAAPAGPGTGAPPPAQSPRWRVLVVDDNRDIAESLMLMLKKRGHDVRMAHDGPSALTAAAGFTPEVVLLDIGLPGIDGYEVARRLRTLPKLTTAFIVALTGYGQPEVRRRAFQAGFDVHLVKPVDLQALNEVLNQRRPVH